MFVNCPFDAAYKPLFDAIVFAVLYCDFEVRSALEISDAGELRLAKIIRLIDESRLSIHDISRIELDQASGLPRFNMPIELGIAIGARYFGRSDRDGHVLLVLDTEQYRYQSFASDLAGIDIREHGGEIKSVIAAVRDFLTPHSDMSLPGAAAIGAAFDAFETRLPMIAAKVQQRPEELTFVDRLRHLSDWLRERS